MYERAAPSLIALAQEIVYTEPHHHRTCLVRATADPQRLPVVCVLSSGVHQLFFCLKKKVELMTYQLWKDCFSG